MKFAAPPDKQRRGSTASAKAELLARRESSIKRRTAEVQAKNASNPGLRSPIRPVAPQRFSLDPLFEEELEDDEVLHESTQEEVFKILKTTEKKKRKLRRSHSSQSLHEQRNEGDIVSTRRNNRLHVMASGAQTAKVRTMLENAIKNSVEDFKCNDSALEQLHEIMTLAKESGISVERILDCFHGGNPEVQYISLDDFLAGLDALGDGAFMATDHEVIELGKMFDVEQDGTVSLAEFKTYCYYHIDTVPWKAERSRLEKSGGILQVTKDLKKDFHKRLPLKIYNCGKAVYKGDKVFWRIDTSLEIAIYYCTELDVMTIQCYNMETKEPLPLLYIKKSNCVINVEGNEHNPEKEHKSEWEPYGNYILARIKLQNKAGISNEISYIPYLDRLTGDSEKILMMAQPVNIAAPPDQQHDPIVTKEAFRRASVRVERATQEVRESRQGLEVLSRAVSDFIQEMAEE